MQHIAERPQSKANIHTPSNNIYFTKLNVRYKTSNDIYDENLPSLELYAFSMLKKTNYEKKFLELLSLL